MNYTIKRAPAGFKLTGNFDSPGFKDAGIIELKNYMGDKPAHQPKTQAKVIYDDQALYIIFRVEDRFVRAVFGHQGPVCRDSCVEFFFTPHTDVAKGYFNIEANCGGNILFHFQVIPRKDAITISKADCDKMTVYADLPEKVDPEITEPTIWHLAYRLPVSILKNYSTVIDPAPGVVWKANFFKCGDDTSHPHWLTWAKVDRPKPDFHRPESFVDLIFE